MKKLLFLLVILIPNCSHAQIEVGINYGMQPWRRTFDHEPNNRYDVHGVGSIMAAYNFRFIRAAVEYSRADLSSVGTYNSPYNHHYYFADPMNEYTALAAYYHFCRRYDWYAGARISALSFHGHFDDRYPFTNVTSNGSGLGYGILFGSNYRIWRGLCINLQAAVCHADTKVTTSGTSIGEDYWYFPLTFGVHYQLIHRICGN
jgi:hypothetical protein